MNVIVAPQSPTTAAGRRVRVMIVDDAGVVVRGAVFALGRSRARS